MVVLARTTQYNRITSPEKLEQVHPDNLQLKNDFLTYLKSVQRSDGTITGYSNDLDIVLVFLLERCGNKRFVDAKKRDWLAFQSWLIDEHGNSPARVRRIKAAISSLSNFVTNVLQEDEEPGFENFKPTIKGVESPVNTPVREKTILTTAQCEALLDQLVQNEEYQKACVFALALYSGRRKQELLRFRVSFFDDSNLVYGSLYRSPVKIQTKGRGNKGKLLTVFTLKDFKPYFDLWMQHRPSEYDGDDLLFPGLTVATLNSWANTFSRMLGVDFYWHALRHTWTTELARKGVPDNVIQAIQGWDSNMVPVYKDIDTIDELGKYFTEDGIRGRPDTTLTEL